MLNSSFHPSLALQTVTCLHRVPTQRWHFAHCFTTVAAQFSDKLKQEWGRELQQGWWMEERGWHLEGPDLIKSSATLSIFVSLLNSKLPEDKVGIRGQSAHQSSMPAQGTEEINVWHHQQTFYQVTQTRATLAIWCIGSTGVMACSTNSETIWTLSEQWSKLSGLKTWEQG